MSNVRHFGAQGDGKADDTAAVAHAVEKAGDGLLEFPRGEYLIRRTIEIRLGQRGRFGVSGLGGAGRVVMAGPGPAFRFVGSHTKNADPSSFAAGVLARERMPTLQGLEIVGAHPQADGVEFVRVMQPTLIGVLIREVRDGVRLFERDRNFLMDACHVYNCRGVGVHFDRVNLHQAIIQGCHVSYCKGGGIKVVGSEIRNLQITGNDVEYNHDPAAPVSAAVWIESGAGGVREGTIVGNTIQAKISPGGANVRFVGPDDVNKISMWTVTGNHISNQEINVLVKNCRGMVFSGNSIAVGGKRSVSVENSRNLVLIANSLEHNPDYKEPTLDGVHLRDCDGCIVTSSVVEGVKAGSAKEGGAIEVIRCRETSVTGCHVLEPKYRGVFVSDSRNTRVADCTVVGKDMVAAIEVVKSPGTLIRGNLTGKGTAGDIVAPGAMVEGNQRASR